MANYPNIDKSGFNRGEYIGYSNCRKFRISQAANVATLAKWIAIEIETGQPARFAMIGGCRLHSETLGGISRLLTELERSN